MSKRILTAMIIFGTAFLFTGCAGEKMSLEVKAKIDGKPAAQARVAVDGVEEGVTAADGSFTKVLERKPGAEVSVVVTKDQAGYRTQPWKTAFLMKLPKEGMDRYVFDADIPAVKYVTIVAKEKGAPVADAAVLAAGKEAGKTGANGEFVYDYQALPEGGIDLAVTKAGYGAWKRKVQLEPGMRVEAELAKRVVVMVMALAEEYGQSSGIAGLAVTIDKKEYKTDAKGAVSWTYDGEPGKKVAISIAAPGYLPASWKTTVALEGDRLVQRYFYPTTPKPIRTGIYKFVGNTPNVDLKAVLAQTEESVGGQLFKFGCFKEVPTATLQAEMKQAKLNVDKITVKGWRETPLKRTVDMIVLGSVAKDENGFLIETKFTTSGGKLIHSQLARAKNEGAIAGAAKEIAAAVLAKFPFEGTVIDVQDEERPRINLGKTSYKIGKSMEFNVMKPRLDESGKASGYAEVGRLKVKKADDAASVTEVEALKKGEKIALGDRVVRLVVREDEDQEKNTVILSTKGGLLPDTAPLAGVNVYLNEEWIGTTGADGKAEVAVRLGKKYDIVLYRHGYQQVTDKLRVEKSRDVKEFTLMVNNSVFKVDSRPSSADVSVDGEKIGRTPLLEGKPVTLGFHTVRIALGGDYRDWEEVIEFASKTEDRTGAKAVTLHKDFLKLGEKAEQKGDLDGAIASYKSAEKGHPDYSEAHHRLATIYLDEKSDYDGAIREFENVLSLPENQQLVYKQFSVAFTNLGHAYYEKGNAMVATDKQGAAQNFAKAVQNLQKARQNTRFFPTMRYDEAVHDTYYYTALSYHKLYLITKKVTVLNDANTAWREYFDFFPRKLEGNPAYEQSRQAAQKYWDQIRQ